jgi:predicted ribosome quality control (RQC) complex YloA/Tae2 family protein
VVIDPERKAAAIELKKKIDTLKQHNEDQRAFIALCRKVAKEYSIQVDTSGLIADKPEVFCISKTIGDTKYRSGNQIEVLKVDFMDGKINAAEFEKRSAEINKPMEKRLKEIEAAKGELDKFLEDIARRP